MHRMLIERIENRVLVGIVAFVGIMVLVGWVAINENARMASFTRQYEARAIERGGHLFAANCATCHGADGLGINGRAPGLNNPALFGYDFLATWNDELESLSKEADQLEEEKTTLQAELAAPDLTDRRKAQIEARIAEIDTTLADPARADEIARLQAERQAQIDSMVAAIDLGYDPDQPSRASQLGWAGTLNAFLVSTIHGGRPTSNSYWSQGGMPTWGNTLGGPLRDDQIQDITTYILNWDKGDAWTLEDLLSVRQFAIIPGQGGGEATADPVGTDVEAAFVAVDALVGDPVRGQALYENKETTERASRLGCSGCHYGGMQGPTYDAMWPRVVNQVATDPALADLTPEHYIIESIIEPGAYIVPGFSSGVMPSNFGTLMSAQDLADILEFIKSSDPDYVAPEQPADTGD